MIDKATYEKMMAKWGEVSSWAVWCPRTDTPTSNVGNMDWTSNPNLLEMLNTPFVFVGLNCGGDGTSTSPTIVPWRNFHSSSGRAKDYKLRHAFSGTPYWGSYITDFFKGIPTINAHILERQLKTEPWRMEKAVENLEKEIECLGGNKVLVGIGKDAYAYLVEHFGNRYKVVGIRHYSDTRKNDVNYRAEVIEALKKVK